MHDGMGMGMGIWAWAWAWHTIIMSFIALHWKQITLIALHWKQIAQNITTKMPSLTESNANPLGAVPYCITV
jgi:hypothetical protein